MAHRYEAEHRQPLPAEEFPYRDIQFPLDFVYERWPVVTVIATAILSVQVQHRDLYDSAVYSALESLAEMYRTLGSGIYYERPPAAPPARALYTQISQSLQDFQKN